MAVNDGHHRPPVERALVRNTAIIIALLLAIAGLAVGGIAISRTATVAQCINSNLGERNGPAAADAAAHIAFADALTAVVHSLITEPPGPKQQAAFVELEKITDKYAQTLKDDQAARDANPLGQC